MCGFGGQGVGGGVTERMHAVQHNNLQSSSREGRLVLVAVCAFIICRCRCLFFFLLLVSELNFLQTQQVFLPKRTGHISSDKVTSACV